MFNNVVNSVSHLCEISEKESSVLACKWNLRPVFMNEFESVRFLKITQKLATLPWIYQATFNASKVTGIFTGMHLTCALACHQSRHSCLLLHGSRYALIKNVAFELKANTQHVLFLFTQDLNTTDLSLHKLNKNGIWECHWHWIGFHFIWIDTKESADTLAVSTYVYLRLIWGGGIKHLRLVHAWLGCRRQTQRIKAQTVYFTSPQRLHPYQEFKINTHLKGCVGIPRQGPNPTVVEGPTFLLKEHISTSSCD